MGQITTDQSHQVLATLAINTNWEKIDFEEAKLQEFIIRHPKMAGTRFESFLKNCGVTVNVRAFQVWKTVKLGAHKDTVSLKQAMGSALGRNWSEAYQHEFPADMMSDPAFTLATEGATLDLINVSLGDLGFTEPTKLRDICARANELGLSLCPAEVGPQLRLQYTDQPMGWLRIAMKTITVWRDWQTGKPMPRCGYPCVFNVAHGDGGLFLLADYGRPYFKWERSDRFVFVLPKPGEQVVLEDPLEGVMTLEELLKHKT